MARMACVDLPEFPLQILLKRRAEWRELPAAVVDKDGPQGTLLWVNERARATRVLPGMRYAAALALARDLRAGVVSAAEIEAETEAVFKVLRFFSPEVEGGSARANDRGKTIDVLPWGGGTFWLGAEGLGLLYPSFPRWAQMIRTDLAAQAGYAGRVAVGFSRFGSFAAVQATTGVIVFRDAEEEHAAVRGIPIERIITDPDVRDTLARLGIQELGGFLDLPPAGVRRRFGERAHALYRMARGESWSPLTPVVAEEPCARRIVLDNPESDTGRLLEAVAGGLRELIDSLRSRNRALSGLVLEIGFDHAGPDGTKRCVERLRPARPTRDAILLLDLLRLRLESMSLPSGVVDVRVEVESLDEDAEQMGLFPDRSARDLAAANRALARVRAEFGEDSIRVARPREAHLPEARFTLEPMERLALAQPRKVRTPVLVRRILTRPAPISLQSMRPPGASISSSRIPGIGVIAEAKGPYVVSGGWWRRPVERSYWYVRIETADSGEAWFWIYHDARRRRWFRHGGIE